MKITCKDVIDIVGSVTFIIIGLAIAGLVVGMAAVLWKVALE